MGQDIKNGAGGTGAQGATGATGAQGPVGLQGPDGAQGLAGAQGPVGLQGPDGAQGLAGAQGPAGVQGPDGLQGQDGLQGPDGEADTATLVADVGTAITHIAGGIPQTVNWSNVRVQDDTINGIGSTFQFSLGRTFIAFNGVFNLAAKVELTGGAGGVTAVELTATQQTTGKTVIHRDYIEIPEGGNINKAVLSLDFAAIGTLVGAVGSWDNIQFDVSVSGEPGAVITIMPGASVLTAYRVGNAPAVYVTGTDNQAEVAASQVT